MAAKKFNKEAIKKNLFWILLGVFVLFWSVAVVMAMTDTNDKAQGDYKKDKTAVETAKTKGVKTAAYQEPWKKHGKKFNDYKEVIWGKAWTQQKDMYTWPESMPVSSRPLYPEDPFVRDSTGKKDVSEDQKIRSSFRTWYEEQFTGLETRVVYPAYFLGGFSAVFPAQKWNRETPPLAEEIWLAQEDFWIRREMLFLVSQAIGAVALFQETTPAKADKLPEGILARRVFRNANWELTILVERGNGGRGFAISDQSTIKNINVSQRTQVLANPLNKGGLPFRIQQGSAISELRIAGEPLPFDRETTLKKKISVSPVDLSKPLIIEQILDWQISPVRRIDTLAVAQQSHRTVTTKLVLNPVLKKLEPQEKPEEDAAAAATTTPVAGTPAGGNTIMKAPGGGPGGGPAGPSGSGGKADEAAEITPVNSIPRERYLQVTPQCRHLPIAMRLIVDQAHIHDILASMSNSRLRLQITQVAFHHVNNVPPPPAPGDTSTTGKTSGPAGPAGPAGPGGPGGAGGMPMGNLSRGPAIAMPLMPGGGSSTALPGGRFLLGAPSDAHSGTGRGGAATAPGSGTAQSIDNARLVELSIYAIASLYERFPPRKETASSPTTPPTR